jgi:glycosyltransferase involved in cell wall biosynthesis
VLGAGPLDLSNYQGKNIEFSGFCEQRTYFDYLRASHIFVLPSVHDNNPLTVVEALYSGNVMVLAEGVGNHPEAVRGNGVVVPANSVDALTIELKRILSLPRPDLERMAAVSLEIARNFSIERSAAGFCKAILQERRDLLIAGRPGESHA